MGIETNTEWFEGDDSAVTDASFKDYQINATPNDFNIRTIFDFIGSGVVKIPGFQRNYVWDIGRASRLIESLLMGLPIPQIFLYEQKRNEFLVIDGQQRLMSIYYFLNGRFPIKNKRSELRHIFAENGSIPKDILANDAYFNKFNLNFPSNSPGQKSKFDGMNYDTLGEYKTSLDLTVVRNIIIRQTSPQEDRDSSIFEIFNRLNTGGVNLTSQEIRSSLYSSTFLQMIDKMTFNPVWRKIIGKPEPDINLKESEILLRSFAFLKKGGDYREPIGLFINGFAKSAMTFGATEIEFAERLFEDFFTSISNHSRDIFSVTSRNRFNISFFEATFRVICENSLKLRTIDIPVISEEKFNTLRNDAEFVNASRFATGQTANVAKRYDRAKEILR